MNKRAIFCIHDINGNRYISPIGAYALAESGLGYCALQGGKWLFRQSLSEGRLLLEGARLLGRKYGKAFIAETCINYFQSGGDPTKMDAFDIVTNTLNPFRLSFRGRIGMNGINSLIDYNIFQRGKNFTYFGNGKNFAQTGLDFSLFNEGLKYTFGILGGINSTTEATLDIISGNTERKAQELAGEQK